MEAEIEESGLEDGAGDGKSARVGSEADAEHAPHHPQHDGEPRDEAVDDFAGVERSAEHGCNANEGKETNGDGIVVVRRASEEKGQDGPEACEGGRDEERYERGLNQDRVFGEHDWHRPEHFEVVQSLVRGWVVWHERPETAEDGILQTNGHPVDVSPGDELGHYAG